MARARYSNNALTPSGVSVHIAPYAEVGVFEVASSTPYTGTLYEGESGPTTLSNPFNADEFGNIEFFLDSKDEVRLEVTGVGLGTRTLDYEPVPPRPMDMISYTSTQAGIEATLALGLPVLLSSGIIQISTTIGLPLGASIHGASDHKTILEWTGAVGGKIFEYNSATFVPSHINITSIGLRSAVADTIGFNIINGGFETLHDIGFYGITEHFHIEGGFRPSIHNVFCAGYGPNSVGGSFFYAMPHLEIDGFTSYGSTTAEAIMTFDKVAAGSVRGFHIYACESIGMIIQGDNQGLNITAGIMTGMYKGILIRAGASGNPSFTLIHGVAIDQFYTYGIEIAAGSQTRIIGCDITNSYGTPDGSGGWVAGSGTAYGIIMGVYPGVQRTHIYDCAFENLGPAAIHGVGGAAYITIIGNFFIFGGVTPAGGAAILFGAGTPVASPRSGYLDHVIIALNDWTHMYNHIVDQSVSGSTPRMYIDNIGATEPDATITNIDGVYIRSMYTMQMDGILLGKQISTPAITPRTGYGALYQKSDGNWYKKVGSVETRMIDNLAATLTLGESATGFGIVQRIRRRDGVSAIAALGFGVTSPAEADVVKGAVAMRRAGGLGTGDILFLLDNNADANDVAITDLAAIIQGVPTAGPHIGSRFAFQYEDSSPMASASMPVSSIHPWVEEGTNLLRFKVSYKDGTTYKTTTGLALT